MNQKLLSDLVSDLEQELLRLGYMLCHSKAVHLLQAGVNLIYLLCCY